VVGVSGGLRHAKVFGFVARFFVVFGYRLLIRCSIILLRYLNLLDGGLGVKSEVR